MAKTNSRLLKIARARDDQELVLRVTAALTVRAQQVVGLDLPPNTREFVTWILQHPMSPVPRAVSYVAVDPVIADKVTYVDGTINSDDVTDDDIIAVINANVDIIAAAFVRYGA